MIEDDCIKDKLMVFYQDVGIENETPSRTALGNDRTMLFRYLFEVIGLSSNRTDTGQALS